jgi:hypothetical protein
VGPLLLLYSGSRGYAELAKVLRGWMGGNTGGLRGTESVSCEGRVSAGLGLQKEEVKIFALGRLAAVSSSKLLGMTAPRPLLEASDLGLLQRMAQSPNLAADEAA